MARSEYLRLAKEFKAKNPICQVKYRCWARPAKSRDIHHKRGRLGPLLTDTRHWLAVCRQCHNWIGDYPVAARTYGWLCPQGLWNVPDNT